MQVTATAAACILSSSANAITKSLYNTCNRRWSYRFCLREYFSNSFDYSTHSCLILLTFLLQAKQHWRSTIITSSLLVSLLWIYLFLQKKNTHAQIVWNNWWWSDWSDRERKKNLKLNINKIKWSWDTEDRAQRENCNHFLFSIEEMIV